MIQSTIASVRAKPTLLPFVPGEASPLAWADVIRNWPSPPLVEASLFLGIERKSEERSLIAVRLPRLLMCAKRARLLIARETLR